MERKVEEANERGCTQLNLAGLVVTPAFTLAETDLAPPCRPCVCRATGNLHPLNKCPVRPLDLILVRCHYIVALDKFPETC